MENIIDLIVNNISQVLIASLVAIVSYVFATIGSKIKNILDDKRIKGYVEDAVNCVNQAYETLSNEEKYQQAESDIITWLNDEGLKITEAKLKVLIESAVKKMKEIK